MQAGGYDCSLFAIAFVTALAFGKAPCQYYFDQNKMRNHLLECFEKKKIAMFPVKRMRRANEQSVKASEQYNIYCLQNARNGKQEVDRMYSL